MNRVLYIVLIVGVVSFTILAQKKQPVKPTVKPSPTATPTPLPTPTVPVFSFDWEKVPLGFAGDAFQPIYRSLLINEDLNQKGEFETTAQYNQRLNDASKIALTKTLTANDILVFVYKPEDLSLLQGTTVTYNADNEQLLVEIQASPLINYSRGENNQPLRSTYYGTTVAPKSAEEKGKYIGENAYGIKREITKYQFESYLIAITNIWEFSEVERSSFPTFVQSFNIPISQAKDLKNNIAILFTVKLQRPYFGLDGTDIKPTIDKPREITSYTKYLIGAVLEIWIFNKATGEILAKLKPKTKN